MVSYDATREMWKGLQIKTKPTYHVWISNCSQLVKHANSFSVLYTTCKYIPFLPFQKTGTVQFFKQTVHLAHNFIFNSNDLDNFGAVLVSVGR